MKFSVHSLTSSQREEFEQLSANLGVPSGYKWLSTGSFPTAIPQSLQAKLPSGLLMWERVSSGCTVIVCNGIRLDKNANALDQQPFGVAVYSSGASTAGVFIDHGTWEGRSIAITPEVRTVLDSTGLSKYFPLGEIPTQSSGPLSDLSFTSHEGAFRAIVQRIYDPST